MTLKDFLTQPCTSDFHLLTSLSDIDEIPVEYISILEPPVEKFVRTNEIILSTALSVRDDVNTLRDFIYDVYRSGSAGIVFAFPENDFHMLTPVLPEFSDYNFPIISMDWNHLFSEVVENTIKTIWEKDSETQTYMETLQRELLNYFIHGKTMNDAAELLFKYLGSDIVILDCNHKIIGRNRSIRSLSPTGYLESRKNDISRIVISTSDKLYGYILADSNIYNITLHSSSAIQCIVTPLTLWFDREYSITASKMKAKEDFVWKLANHEFQAEQDVISKADYLGFQTDKHYACLVGKILFDSIDNEHHASFLFSSTSTMIEEQIIQSAKDLGLSVMTSLHNQTLIIFLECDNDSHFQSVAENYLSAYEQVMHVTTPTVHFLWGYDSQGYSLFELEKGYQKAQKALSICLDSNGLIKRSCFQLSILQKISSVLYNDAEILTLSKSILKPLLAYDAEKKTNYLETLKIYFSTNYNISETARICHMHRQSLLYRLDKIQNLCGISFHNHEDLYLLEECYRIYSYK